MPLIAVCAAWAVFWGSWSALLLVAGLSGWLGLPVALAALGLLGLPLVARFAFERP